MIFFYTLFQLISPPLPSILVKPFFSALDENEDGHIDFKELSCGVSAGNFTKKRFFYPRVLCAPLAGLGIGNAHQLFTFLGNIIPISYKDSLTVPKNVDHIPDWSYLMLNCKQTADCKQIADAAIAKNRTNLVLN